MYPNQEEIDEALALSLMYDDPTINDAITAMQFQQEGKLFIRFLELNQYPTRIGLLRFQLNLNDVAKKFI